MPEGAAGYFTLMIVVGRMMDIEFLDYTLFQRRM
jgi:hypothetical protein